MTSEIIWSGSCICGHAGYVANGPAIFQGRCYCADCHKESGTGHVSTLAVADTVLEVSGELNSFTRPCDRGGTITHSFCPLCATTLFHRSSNLQGVTILRAGTLDDDSNYTPEIAIYA